MGWTGPNGLLWEAIKNDSTGSVKMQPFSTWNNGMVWGETFRHVIVKYPTRQVCNRYNRMVWYDWLLLQNFPLYICYKCTRMNYVNNVFLLILAVRKYHLRTEKLKKRPKNNHRMFDFWIKIKF